MAEIQDLDTTAANNTSAPPDGAPENMSYTTVNDVGRELGALVARALADHNGSIVSTGSSGAFAITSNRSITALEDGLTFVFQANHSYEGSSATLNLNSLGAADLRYPHSTEDEIIRENGLYLVTYEATAGDWFIMSATEQFFKLPNVKTVTDSTYTISSDDRYDIIHFTGNTIAVSGSLSENRTMKFLIPNKSVTITYTGTWTINSVVQGSSSGTTGNVSYVEIYNGRNASGATLVVTAR